MGHFTRANLLAGACLALTIMGAAPAFAQSASSCDRAVKEPPFFDTSRAPGVAVVKKRFQAGPMIFTKGIPVVVLDTRDTKSCVLLPGADGPLQGWIESDLLTVDTKAVTAADWLGHWRAGGQTRINGLEKALPDWAKDLAPAASGSKGDIFIYTPADFERARTAPASPEETAIFAEAPPVPANDPPMPATIAVAGKKSFSTRGGIATAAWAGAADLKGRLLVYDNRGATPETRCMIVMIYLPGDALWTNSYGGCGLGTHDDGWYRRAN